MDDVILKLDKINYNFPFIFVEGTGKEYFLFGLENERLKIAVKDFFISKFPVTQVLWEYIMGYNPSHFADKDKPVEGVSYNDIVKNDGFLQRINASTLKEEITKQFKEAHSVQFRLPSETEWEYAARGGINWTDYFVYSGSNNIDEVGWYKRNSQNESKPVGQKKPNQLGICDMCGNLWEWCHDYFQRDINKIPNDGSPCLEPGPDRVLRGGCYHNGGIHCTVMKRYEISPESKDPCIGFRLVLSF